MSDTFDGVLKIWFLIDQMDNVLSMPCPLAIWSYRMPYTTEELQPRADLLAYIEKTEGEAEWTDLEELQERANLLTHIEKAEGEAEWSDLEELRERAALLERIA